MVVNHSFTSMNWQINEKKLGKIDEGKVPVYGWHGSMNYLHLSHSVIDEWRIEIINISKTDYKC